MTVTTTANSVTYIGNGATTEFAIPFRVLDEDHLVVERRVIATGLLEHIYIGSEIIVTLGDESGTVEIDGTALSSDYQVVIRREVPITQDLDIVNAGGFYPDTVERQLDMIVMGMQGLEEQIDQLGDPPVVTYPTEGNNIIEWGADPLGVVDCTGDFQAALYVGHVVFPPGNYTMSYLALGADVVVPGNRKIIVEAGAHITMTGGRFVSENVDNVEWLINGEVESVAMLPAASKPDWYAGTDNQRGFIEFGSDYSAGTARSGFKVHGSGVVHGDWTGTPNVADYANQVNKKGIACWNAKNVYVGGIEVYGFHGEAVYATFFDEASYNIIFDYVNVHDTRFNALNFNAGANGGNCLIKYCRAVNSYGIEASTGDIFRNHVEDSIESGIRGGSGAGYGTLRVHYNTIKNAGQHGVEVVFASGTPVTDVSVKGNDIDGPGQYAVYADYVRNLTVVGNTHKGTGRLSGGYEVGINHTLRGLVANNQFFEPGAFAQAARIVRDANSFDVVIDPDSNVYIATTGTSTGKVGNGVIDLASAAALTIPILGSEFAITGGTTITSIVATGNDGREITLSNAAMTDGSNLKLNGNLVAGADTLITLRCDGTNWKEKCRSVN